MTPDLITVELERLRVLQAQIKLDTELTLRHYEAQLRALRGGVAADDLVLERLPNGEYAWLRPEAKP